LLYLLSRGYKTCRFLTNEVQRKDYYSGLMGEPDDTFRRIVAKIIGVDRSKS